MYGVRGVRREAAGAAAGTDGASPDRRNSERQLTGSSISEDEKRDPRVDLPSEKWRTLEKIAEIE